MGAVGEDPGDVNDPGGGVAEVAGRSGPSISVCLDEAVLAEPAEDRRGVAGAHAEDARGGVDGEGRVLAERGVEPAGEVSEAGAGEQVVSLVNEFVLEESDELGAMREEFGRGAGVIEWL